MDQDRHAPPRPDDLAGAPAGTCAPRPSHVPPHLAFDFDALRPPGADEDLHAAWKAVQDRYPPIFWTPRNGGHWVACRGRDIRRMQIDGGLFSHAKYTVPYDPSVPQTPPASTDAPLHAPYRALIAPALDRQVVTDLEPKIRQVARETAAALQPRGGCEFIGDFAQVLPITIFLGLVGLPYEDRAILLPLAHKAARPQSAQDRLDASAGVHAYLAQVIEARTRSPGLDLISQVIRGRIGERPINEEEVLGICATLLFGGLDTVASMMGFFTHHLATHPEQRRRLAAEPELLPRAVEELIRRFGVANTARMVTRDADYEGIALRRGDQIMLPNSLIGLDEELTPDPMTVDFDRPEAVRHAAFGSGPHNCPGAPLARLEFRIFLEEWIKLIPEFSLRPGARPLYATGTINSVQELQLVWPLEAAGA